MSSEIIDRKATPEDLQRIFGIVRTLHPDIVSIRWDRTELVMIEPSGEELVVNEFEASSLSAYSLDAVEWYLIDNKIIGFDYTGP